jgi:CO dehydrogenase/acetyl-CoA synthase gamma subunit (corrinoid Fe-S protein)
VSSKQIIINKNKKYYDKHNCKFAFCESCYWFATILVEDKFNNIKQCYMCDNKNIHNGTILI